MRVTKDPIGGFELDLGLAAWKRFIIAMTLLGLLFSVALRLIEVDPVKFGEMILVALFSYISGLLTFYYLDHNATPSDLAGDTEAEFATVGKPVQYEGRFAYPSEFPNEGSQPAAGSVGPDTKPEENKE